MFLLWKNILWIPIAILVTIGTPFKWDNDGSSLKNTSEATIRAKYNEAKIQHYIGRIFASAAFIIGCMIFIFLSVVSDGMVLLIFPIITLIVLLIDGFMMFCRYVFFQQEEKKAEQRQELVVIDVWKDTSLKGIFEQRKEARQKYRDEYFKNTGREPAPDSYY